MAPGGLHPLHELEMNQEKEQPVYEICLVIPKRKLVEEGDVDAIKVLINEFHNVGLLVDIVSGLAEEFIKLGATVDTLGKAAASLRMTKRTRIGMELPFEWDQAEAFATEGDGSLFSWCERYSCYNSLLYGVVNESKSDRALRFDGKEACWGAGERLLHRLEFMGVVKQIFPLHDELMRKQLMRSWAFNWRDLTEQPIDHIYFYFGTKIATYFAFLGMYTRWLLFPAAFGVIIQIVSFGALQYMVLPFFFICIIIWAVLFFQFWKRKNFALVTRLRITSGLEGEWDPPQEVANRAVRATNNTHNMDEKEVYQKFEWVGHLLRFRNNAIVLSTILCLQLPIELAYAHLYDTLHSNFLRLSVTAGYLIIIQYFTGMGGKISVRLIKEEKNESREYRADSLVYKVFGVYFLQTYVGLFYHALVHRNINTLRQIVLSRLIVSEVFENVTENCLPYITYKFRKYTAVRKEKKLKGKSSKDKVQITSRVEKEFLKPAYTARIGDDLEDGLFDDFLELVLQFGMIMMFACAFPPAFAFAAMNNITEIRTDALKMLVTLKRPVPRAAATIGAWLNIFQFLIVMSICTNCALLVCLYDAEGRWKIEPGLAAILVIEHILLFIKFGLSHFIPEEPAWVKANRLKSTVNQNRHVSNSFLKSISSREHSSATKNE
ncbi:hypothetical protein V2J09_022570 [Rumex salicifolius]